VLIVQCRKVVTRLAPELGVYGIEVLSRRLVSKYGLGLDAAALESCSESFLLFLAFGQQRAEIQAIKLDALRRATPGGHTTTSLPQTPGFLAGRRIYSAGDAPSHPDAVYGLLDSLDTGSFTTWTPLSSAMKSRKAPSRKVADAIVRQSSPQTPMALPEEAAKQAATKRRTHWGSNRKQLQEEGTESTTRLRAANSEVGHVNQAHLPAIHTIQRATAH